MLAHHGQSPGDSLIELSLLKLLFSCVPLLSSERCYVRNYYKLNIIIQPMNTGGCCIRTTSTSRCNRGPEICAYLHMLIFSIDYASRGNDKRVFAALRYSWLPSSLLRNSTSAFIENFSDL